VRGIAVVATAATATAVRAGGMGRGGVQGWEHGDGDVRSDDPAPQRGHPLPVIHRRVGVGDGNPGGEGVRVGELEAW
jgi:hypothetical protein